MMMKNAQRQTGGSDFVLYYVDRFPNTISFFSAVPAPFVPFRTVHMTVFLHLTYLSMEEIIFSAPSAGMSFYFCC
jgi:hypothetical protein